MSSGKDYVKGHQIYLLTIGRIVCRDNLINSAQTILGWQVRVSNVRLKNIKAERNEIVEQNSKFQGHEIKVKGLRRRPNEPLGRVNDDSLVVDFSADFSQRRIIQQAESQEEDGEAEDGERGNR